MGRRSKTTKYKIGIKGLHKTFLYFIQKKGEKYIYL